jgi:hypothetical protein
MPQMTAGFQAGLLSVSEVAFDEAHQFAVFRFSFICGSLCGRGGTLVFVKVDGKWRKSDRACPLWIARIIPGPLIPRRSDSRYAPG